MHVHKKFIFIQDQCKKNVMQQNSGRIGNEGTSSFDKNGNTGMRTSTSCNKLSPYTSGHKKGPTCFNKQERY